MEKKYKISRGDDNRTGKFCIKLILIVFMIVMSVQIVKVYQKDQEYSNRQAELQKQLEYEENRKLELEEYQSYTGSREYIEDIAKSKLGLLYENEIVFRER